MSAGVSGKSFEKQKNSLTDTTKIKLDFFYFLKYFFKKKMQNNTPNSQSYIPYQYTLAIPICKINITDVIY